MKLSRCTSPCRASSANLWRTFWPVCDFIRGCRFRRSNLSESLRLRNYGADRNFAFGWRDDRRLRGALVLLASGLWACALRSRRRSRSVSCRRHRRLSRRRPCRSRGSTGDTTRDMRLEILKDSRIGTFGTLALIGSILLRVLSLWVCARHNLASCCWDRSQRGGVSRTSGPLRWSFSRPRVPKVPAFRQGAPGRRCASRRFSASR